MMRINLLPVRVSKKKEAGKNQLIFFGLFIVLAVICNSWWSIGRAEDVKAREAKLARTRAEIAQLEKIIGEVKNIKAEQAAVKEKLAVLDKLKSGRQGPVRVLDALATLIPKRVWVSRFQESGGAVRLEGSAGTIEDVSTFLTALKASPFFSDMELQRTQAKSASSSGPKIVEFSMSGRVNYTPPPTATAAAKP